nr:hypothetical protein [Sphingopyxis sp. PET50]
MLDLDDMLEARHDPRDLGRGFRAARHARAPDAFAAANIVGDAADAKAAGLQRVERRDHRRTHRARDDGEHRFTLQLMPQCARFGGEQAVERGGVDLGALELGPGIVVGVGRIHPPHEIARQSAFVLQTIKSLKGRGGDDAAEVEDDGGEAHGMTTIPALGSARPDSMS